MDPNTKGAQIETISNGTWKKAASVSIADHHKQFAWLLYCFEYLEGGFSENLTEEQRNKYYFKLFPPEWQKKFILSGKVFKNTDMQKINTYMVFIKMDADK